MTIVSDLPNSAGNQANMCAAVVGYCQEIREKDDELVDQSHAAVAAAAATNNSLKRGGVDDR